MSGEGTVLVALRYKTEELMQECRQMASAEHKLKDKKGYCV